MDIATRRRSAVIAGVPCSTATMVGG